MKLRGICLALLLVMGLCGCGEQTSLPGDENLPSVAPEVTKQLQQK